MPAEVLENPSLASLPPSWWHALPAIAFDDLLVKFDATKTDPALLVHAATHPDRQVRWSLAQAPATPRAALEILAKDPDDNLKMMAQMRLAGLDD